jgi:adenylate kinase
VELWLADLDILRTAKPTNLSTNDDFTASMFVVLDGGVCVVLSTASSPPTTLTTISHFESIIEVTSEKRRKYHKLKMSEDDQTTRRRPNILVTGTPCVGKTATAILIAERLGMKHICVGDVIKEHNCYDGRDEELDSAYLDEDKLLDTVEAMFETAAEEGVGIVADFHAAELFPERWFDLILVLRAETNVLFDRLTARGYSEKKRSENMECEIMQVVLEEAREAYAPEIVQEVQSNTLEDMESNVTRVEQWCKQWIADHNNES